MKLVCRPVVRAGERQQQKNGLSPHCDGPFYQMYIVVIYLFSGSCGCAPIVH